MANQQKARGLFGTLIVAVAGILLTWAAFELALAPVLRPARRAMDKSLDPNYDVDDDDANAKNGAGEDNKENEELEVGVTPGSENR